MQEKKISISVDELKLRELIISELSQFGGFDSLLNTTAVIGEFENYQFQLVITRDQDEHIEETDVSEQCVHIEDLDNITEGNQDVFNS